jgi:hypothetical protein
MRPPVIPDTLRICTTCKDDLTALGERECADCLVVTRMALWLLRDPELPVATPMQDALRWATCDTMAVPRITEVPQRQPSHAVRAEFARRVTPWLGLLGLLILSCGWLFGRFGC